MDPDAPRTRVRRQVLTGLGATPDVCDEVLAYCANPFDVGRLDALALPLPDEPQIDAWREYAADAAACGVLPALSQRLVQLRFPIAAGISQTEEYRAATRRGVPPARAEGLRLEAPEQLVLALHPTAAGQVPVLTVGDRRDFVRLVQACSCRNEPEPIPESMGACIVVGLNNWDRVARFRRRLEAERGTELTEVEWAVAFKDLVPRREQYQDRFIILSRAPYSAVPAGAVGLAQDEWLERSLAIRLAHECTHYFTLRAFGLMRNHLFDEFLADFAGIVRAFGGYDASLFLRFLGLEAYPAYRAGGRLDLYLGKPPLSPAAVAVVRHLVVRAARNVETWATGRDLRDDGARARMVVALAGLTLEELASDEAGEFLASRVSCAPRAAAS